MTEHNLQQSPAEQDTPRPEKRLRRRRWWFWPLVILAVVLLLPLVLIGVVLLALLTETGTAWTIEQIPGLQTEAGQGSLLGQWQADRLEWRGYGVAVQVDALQIDWSPSCLFQKTLCLDTLRAEHINVDVQPSDDSEQADSSEIQLPEINLPVALVVGDVSLGAFVFNGTTIWDHMELRSQVSGASLTLEHALYELDDIRVTASGRAEMRRDWPVDLQVTAELPPPAGDQWTVALNLAGSVRDVRLNGTSQGYLDAGLSGTVQPLDKQLPASLKLESARFLAHESLPETLVLNNWVLNLEGSLANGFRTNTRAVLPGTSGDIVTSINGLVTTGGVTGLALTMTGPAAGEEAGQGTLQVQGKASWAGGLAADADLTLDRFPWYGLLPGLEAPAVVINRVQGRVAYRENSYTADLEAGVSGPLGEAELNAALEGDLESVRISELNMSTGAGSLSGQAELDFAGQLAWQARLVLDQFNPGYWLAMLEGNLNGQVNSEGRLQQDGLPVMSADWDLEGRWQQEPAAIRGALASDGRDWLVNDLLIAVADNRVEGRGRYGAELAGELSVELPQPGRLLAGLAGELSASFSVAGTLDDPTAELNLTANAFEWQNLLLIDDVELQADLTSGGVLDASLRAQDLRIAGQELDQVAGDLSGTRDRHQLELAVVHPEASVLVTLAGALGEGWATWQGDLTRGEIDVPGAEQTWRLAEVASVAYDENGAVTFGAHCWIWQDSSVCAGDQQLWPDTRIAYQIRQFPMQALAPLFPETFRWKAFLNADVDLALTDQGPDGRISLDAGSGAFEFLILDDWQLLQHDTLTLEARLKPELAELAIALEGPELGTFNTNLVVDPVAENRPIEGSFSLQSLNLAFLSVFAGIEEVAGEVNGQGQLSGPLFRPQVHGELALTNGRVFDPGLPLPMDDIVLALEFLGSKADISGRWQSNDRSSGQLSGMLNWEGEPEVQLNITGERLPVTFEPYARVEIEPDLNITFRAGELSVSGRVAVPRGDIEIKGLPASAVSVSEDEVIVGVEQEEPTIRTMLMDVTVVVGEDEVTFNAFDVTGNLEGTLRIGNNMDARGTLQLLNGRYEAFGQDLDLRRARIIFVGALTEPYLDIEAVRTVDAVVAGIRLSGPVSAPETEVFSEPSMPQSDALSYIILGRPPQGQGDEGQMSRAAISLGLTQASKFTQGLGDELGIRNLTLEAEGSGDQSAVVASGYITDELSLRYGVGIFEPITTVAIRYDLGRYFYLEAASGLAASLDIFYTRNF